MKKIVAVIISVVMLLSFMQSAAAVSVSFPDVLDSSMARDVAVLQMLGVISGDENGNFVPAGSLTRAAFCKMAVITMGKADEVALYKNRTIFPDVRSTHWARGYINLAVSGEEKIIIGMSDGTFRPDAAITCAQAVTILIRVLGYTDADAGMLWPDGYMTLAKELGLTDGLDIKSSGDSITRAQAAHLFRNLLDTEQKGGGKYITALGSAISDVVIMQLDVTASDGTAGAIKTSEAVYKTQNGVVPPAILGQRGTILVNANGLLLTFLPQGDNQLTITASAAEAAWIKDAAGVRYDIPSSAPAYTAGETTTYGSAFIDIAAGMQVTLFYSSNGKVEALFINTSKAGEALIAGASVTASSLSALTGGDTGYKVFKNGGLAALADIRQYDVMTYNASTKSLYVSNFRLTGYYENCWPNMAAPSKMTVLGHEFAVLPSAIDSVATAKVGQTITVLLTNDFQVAGVAPSGMASITAVGIVQSGITGTNVSVKLLNGLVLSGDPQLSAYSAAQLNGELVSVISYGLGKISISKLGGNGAYGDLDLTKLTVGSIPLSAGAKVFERVGSSGVTQISLSELVQTKVSGSKVLYAGLDYAGRVDMLILNDVTGDRYTYGLLLEGEISYGYLGAEELFNRSVAVVNSGNKSGTTPVITGYVFTNGAPGGVVVSADGEGAEAVTALTEVKNIKRSAFYVRDGMVYVLINSVEYPVAQNVECYNSQGKTWFASLNDARAYAETLTVYYDRAAAEGGKIRMVAVG